MCHPVSSELVDGAAKYKKDDQLNKCLAVVITPLYYTLRGIQKNTHKENTKIMSVSKTCFGVILGKIWNILSWVADKIRSEYVSSELVDGAAKYKKDD